MNDIHQFRRKNEKPSYTLSDALISYRSTIGLSQQQLADLTFELFNQGIVTQGLVQQHISRIEGGASPHEPTLVILATALAEAYKRAGWDTTPQEIIKHLRNAKSVKVHARDVSEYAAELDAILAPLKGEPYTLFWESKIAEAKQYVKTFSRLTEERKAHQQERESQRRQSEADTTHRTDT